MFLKVKTATIAEYCEPLIEIDQYVPLRAQLVQKESFAKRNVRFGDTATSLFEVFSQINNGEFCHLALVFFKQRSTRPIEVTGPYMQGVPVFDIESWVVFRGTQYCRYADFYENIAAYICNRFFEISIGGATFCDRVIASGRLQFLLRGDDFVGIRVANISTLEFKYLKTYF